MVLWRRRFPGSARDWPTPTLDSGSGLAPALRAEGPSEPLLQLSWMSDRPGVAVPVPVRVARMRAERPVVLLGSASPPGVVNTLVGPLGPK